MPTPGAPFSRCLFDYSSTNDFNSSSISRVIGALLLGYILLFPFLNFRSPAAAAFAPDFGVGLAVVLSAIILHFFTCQRATAAHWRGAKG